MRKKWALAVGITLTALIVASSFSRSTFAQSFFSPNSNDATNPDTVTDTPATDVKSLSPGDFRKRVEELGQKNENQLNEQAKQDAADFAKQQTPSPTTTAVPVVPAPVVPAPEVPKPDALPAPVTPPPEVIPAPVQPQNSVPTTPVVTTPPSTAPMYPDTKEKEQGKSNFYTGFGSDGQNEQGKNQSDKDQQPAWDIKY